MSAAVRSALRKSLLVGVLALAGAGVAWAIASRQPVLYESEAILRLRSATVLPELAGMSISRPVADVLAAAAPAVLSRTRLERIAIDLNLYERERRSMIMQDVIQRMRQAIDIVPAESTAVHGMNLVSVRYRGEDPGVVQKVTELVAASLIRESAARSGELAENTVTLLEASVEEAGRAVTQMDTDVRRPPADGRRAIELDVLRTTYRTLLIRLQEARLQVDMARMQIGEQMHLLEPARRAETPMGPSRRRLIGVGALIGLVLGVGLLGVRAVAPLVMAGGRKSAELAPMR